MLASSSNAAVLSSSTLGGGGDVVVGNSPNSATLSVGTPSAAADPTGGGGGGGGTMALSLQLTLQQLGVVNTHLYSIQSMSGAQVRALARALAARMAYGKRPAGRCPAVACPCARAGLASRPWAPRRGQGATQCLAAKPSTSRTRARKARAPPPPRVRANLGLAGDHQPRRARPVPPPGVWHQAASRRRPLARLASARPCRLSAPPPPPPPRRRKAPRRGRPATALGPGGRALHFLSAQAVDS